MYIKLVLFANILNCHIFGVLKISQICFSVKVFLKSSVRTSVFQCIRKKHTWLTTSVTIGQWDAALDLISCHSLCAHK